MGRPDGNYRTLHTLATLIGCLLEVLACFRPTPPSSMNSTRSSRRPTTTSCIHHHTRNRPTTWLVPRVATTGTLIGTFCAVTNTVTLSTL